MIEEWIVKEPKNGPVRYALLALAGRYNSARLMMQVAEDFQLPNTVLVAIQPYGLAWYPQPFSATDQKEAVQGLPVARSACMKLLGRISKAYRLSHKKIAVVGFSAGGVMALQMATHASKPFGGAVSMSGAILEPIKVPQAPKSHTPIMLVHNFDDGCFDWYERYLPMKISLLRRGYNVITKESRYGGHRITAGDIIEASRFFADSLGIEDWEHPRLTAYKSWQEQEQERERRQRIQDEEEEEEEDDDDDES